MKPFFEGVLFLVCVNAGGYFLLWTADKCMDPIDKAMQFRRDRAFYRKYPMRPIGNDVLLRPSDSPGNMLLRASTDAAR